jgi:MFS family permease
VFAIFMLPLFGVLSDRTKSKMGKRMPFITIGIIAASVCIILLPVFYVLELLPLLIVGMVLVILTMGMFRNPAVSLMPDFTPKPLRAKANGLINLIGYVGAIAGGGIGIFLSLKLPDLENITSDNPVTLIKDNVFLTLLPFIITAVFMIIALVVLLLKINENKILEEVAGDMARGELLAEVETKIEADKPLSKKDRRNLIIILAAVVLWFMGFNAVETFLTGYTTFHLDIGSGPASTLVIILTVASLASFVPCGMLASKIGRKWVIVIGLALVTVSLFVMIFTNTKETLVTADDGTQSLGFINYLLFGIAGIGWAFINCCSYPMIVEMASSKNVGKITGIYYTCSMVAQSITPIGIGAIFSFSGLGWTPLFPYATILMAASIVVFMFATDYHKKVVSKADLATFE